MKTGMENPQTGKPGPERLIAGPLLIVAAIAIIEVLSHAAFKIPNPPAIILLIVVFSTFYGGLLSGTASAVLGWFYFAVFFSISGEPFHYAEGNLTRVIVWGITMPVMVALVGSLKRRGERAAGLATANVRLKEIKRHTENIVASLPAGLVVLDRTLKVQGVNRSFCELFGLGNGDAVGGQDIGELLPLPGLREQVVGVLANGTAVHGIEAGLGEKRLHLAITGIRLAEEEEEEEEDRLLVVVEDVTERKEAEEMLARLGRILDNSSNEIYVFDADTLRFMQANQGARQNLGYSLEELKTLTPLDIKPEFTRHSYEELIAPLRRGDRETVTFETMHKRKNGSLYPVEVRLQISRTETPPVFVTIIQDITERKAAEARIEQLAFYDPLTRLPNRVLGLDRLQQGISAASRHGHALAVMVVDLDLLKHINDSLGHAAGDRLLQEAACRLSGCVQENDTVARIGGDEFVVILNDVMEDAIGMLAQKFLGAMREPFALDGHALHVRCSIGMALHPRDGSDAQTLLRNADAAMYRAKEQGRDTARFYTEEMNRKALERLAIEEDLHQALARSEFVLHYQPRVDLRNGEITGLEALVRWQHPEKGLIPPDRFIPVAEETGLILPLGEWVLREACTQATAWARQGLDPGSMAVNLSARQFRQADLLEKVAATLRETGLAPGSLELEITESMVASQVDSAVATLHRLNALGVRLAIDDFGTGYSSLNQLKRFSVQVLKIDKSFVDGIPSDPDDTTIVTTIVSMAHDMQLRVVAEGVETEAQLAFLRRRGCDEMQGYFFSEPLPVQAAESLLRENRRLASNGTDGSADQRTLLLVDDDEPVLSALTRALRREGYRILKAASARAAFDLLARHPVGVIVSDQRMPEMSGSEFLRRVKQIHPETVRIMLSGLAELKSVADAINEDAADKFLTKPWNDDLLRAGIREAFQHYELARDNRRLVGELARAREQMGVCGV